MTRPDIASAVKAVDRHARNPAARHWKAVWKIIAYLKATKQGSEDSVPAGRGLDCRRSLMRITPTDVTVGGRFQVLRSCLEYNCGYK